MPETCPHCGGELPESPRTRGTRVDEILSPEELAQLVEACRRPPRPGDWRPLPPVLPRARNEVMTEENP